MHYRDFGKTGLKVSALGFGAMRLPQDLDEAVRVMQHAFDLGVNYVDTAPYYMDGTSEISVGKALKGYRDKVYLSTKNPIEDASGQNWRKRLESSLKKLDVDYIDFYHMWGINWGTWEGRINVPEGPLDAAFKAKEEGLIRHISFSFHDNPDNMIKLIDTGVFETLLCQYNLLDRANERGIAHAHQKGMGVVIMGPVGGGRLGTPSDVIQKMIPGGTKTSAELALRFVLANRNVTIALSGMGSMQMVDENVATASREEALSEEEGRRVEEALDQIRQLSDLYCTGCNYCMPCPNGVQIPENFRNMNYHKVYGLTDVAKGGYRHLKEKNQHAEACIECGQCEEKCPQKLPIIKQLKETASALGV